MTDLPTWLNVAWLVLLFGFFAYMAFGLRKTDRHFDNPERERREQEAHDLRVREVEAQEKIATALLDLAFAATETAKQRGGH